MFGFRGVNVAFAALLWIFLGAEASRAQMPEAESYSDALAFCRGGKVDSPALQPKATSPLTLRDDRKVLCVHDWIFSQQELAVVSNLQQGGYAVVKGFGGDISATIMLADMLRSKQAVVIVNDYCFAACASYLLFASPEAFVPRDAIVAWTNLKAGLLSKDCFRFLETSDSDAQHFGTYPCSTFADAQHQALADRKAEFYHSRGFPAGFKEPPESTTIRRILKRKFDQTGTPPADLFWTWNPRYAVRQKTRLIYEAYPRSQDEVDATLARLGLSQSVIFDP